MSEKQTLEQHMELELAARFEQMQALNEYDRQLYASAFKTGYMMRINEEMAHMETAFTQLLNYKLNIGDDNT